ncbi:hypothetical protein [Lonsdalea quercina]|uniref:hypothetical protein n=1 Tax=Lonsdalea quercina TaxID=71657 RepID=UPI0039754274
MESQQNHLARPAAQLIPASGMGAAAHAFSDFFNLFAGYFPHDLSLFLLAALRPGKHFALKQSKMSIASGIISALGIFGARSTIQHTE